MDRCERHAAFGVDVVPEVNCILTTSLLDRGESGVGAAVDASCDIEVHGVAARIADGSTRPEELSTRIMLFREGIASELRVEDDKSGTIDCSIERFDLGDLKGRFVSVPMTR